MSFFNPKRSYLSMKNLLIFLLLVSVACSKDDDKPDVTPPVVVEPPVPPVITPPTGNSKTKVIFDTDMNHDVDDLGAQAMVLNMEKAGRFDIVAMGASEAQNQVRVIDAINEAYGRGNIPIGKQDYNWIRSNSDVPGWHGNYSSSEWTKSFLSQTSHNINPGNTDFAVNVYKRALEGAPDKSVVILTMGQLSNVYQLMKKHPSLVERKVKLMVSMAGDFRNRMNVESNLNM